MENIQSKSGSFGRVKVSQVKTNKEACASSQKRQEWQKQKHHKKLDTKTPKAEKHKKDKNDTLNQTSMSGACHHVGWTLMRYLGWYMSRFVACHLIVPENRNAVQTAGSRKKWSWRKEAIELNFEKFFAVSVTLAFLALHFTFGKVVTGNQRNLHNLRWCEAH